MQTITSTRNPAIQAAKALQTKRGREEAGLFLCEGEHMVAEAIANQPQGIAAVFIDQAQAERFQPMLTTVDSTICYAVPAHVLSAVSQVKTPQGIAATVRLPKSAPLEELGEKLILLEDVQDPGNVGTILRTADAAGFSGSILTQGCADPFSPKTLRATMGSIFRLPVARVEGAAEAVNVLKNKQYAILAAVLDGENFYARAALPQRLCIIIGNEGAGIRPETAQLATHRFRLPMRGGAESLNAAIAAAILMYDVINRGE